MGLARYAWLIRPTAESADSLVEALRAGADVKLVTGETVSATSLMSIDGLHANPMGTWYLLERLDRFIEEKLPGTPKDALVFLKPQ